MGLRYAGQDGTLVLLNTTTQAQLLPGLNIASINFGFPFELLKKTYIGQIGPQYREFDDGYELEWKFDVHDAGLLVAYANAVKGKARGESNLEFAAMIRYVALDAPTLQVVFRDMHWEGLPFESGGQRELLSATHRTKGAEYLIRTI